MTPAGSGETEPAFLMHFLNNLSTSSIRVKYKSEILLLKSVWVPKNI